MKISSIVWAIIIIAALGLGWYLYFSTSPADSTPSNTATATDNNQNNPQNNAGASSNTAAPTTTTATDNAPNNSQQNAAVPSNAAPMQATVTYGPNGFSPSTVTVKQGGVVTFVNQGDGRMWVASGPHPTHEGYYGTTKNQHCASGYGGPAPFDQCSIGATYSFTFGKTGNW
ncbi:MAG: hypothetical protein AAB536_03565, partial [Patescibacteria group bacterium]